jgi:hypothetical protein
MKFFNMHHFKKFIQMNILFDIIKKFMAHQLRITVLGVQTATDNLLCSLSFNCTICGSSFALVGGHGDTELTGY